MPTTRESLFNKLAFLRRQRDDILVPFVKMSIPEEILSVAPMYPGFFKTSRAVEVTTGARTLVTFVSSSFPTDGDSIKIAVPAFIFDEIVSIDNSIEGILKSIAELKRLKADPGWAVLERSPMLRRYLKEIVQDHNMNDNHLIINHP